MTVQILDFKTHGAKKIIAKHKGTEWLKQMQGQKSETNEKGRLAYNP